MTYWQGLFIIGLLYFILETTTPASEKPQRIIAGVLGTAFTCYAGWEWAH